MPVTANDIESYSGDPRIAFGSSSVPGGTGVVWDLGVSDAAWARFAQNKLQVARDNLAELKRKQLLADAALQKELNQGNYRVIPEDVPLFNKEWQKLRDMMKEPGVVAGWQLNDPLNPGWQKMQAQLDYLKQFSSMSTQQGAHADVTFNDVSGNPDKYVNGFDDVNKYRAVGDPFKRKDMVLEPQPNISLDFPAYVSKLKTSISPTQQLTTEIVNGRYVDTTEILYSADKIDAATKVDYQTNKKFKAEMDEAYAHLLATDPVLAQATGSPQRYASATAWDMLNGGSKVIAKNPFFSPADRAAANAITIPMSETVEVVSVDPHEQLPLMSFETFKENYKTSTNPKTNKAYTEDELKSEFNRQKKVISIKEFKTQHPELSDVEATKQYANATKRTPQKIVLTDGHYIAKSGFTPSGNLSGAPDWAIDPETGIGLKPQEIGTQTWNIEIVNDGYISREKNASGGYNYYSGNNAPRGAEKVRGAQVVRNSDKKTFIIPYDESIDAILRNNATPIILQGNPPQTKQENQQPKEKTYDYGGKKFTIDQLKTAAQASGLSLEDYMKELGIK